MIAVSAANARRVNHHELLVRRDNDAFKAIVVCNGKFRLEGARADSVSAALESLLNTTARMLELASQDWETESYPGEKLFVNEDGTRIAMEATPEPADVVTNGDAGEDGMDEGEGEVAAAAILPERRGKLHKITKTYASTGKPRGRSPKLATMKARAQVTGGTPSGKPRGRPPKSASATSGLEANGTAITPKRKVGRPKKAAT